MARPPAAPAFFFCAALPARPPFAPALRTVIVLLLVLRPADVLLREAVVFLRGVVVFRAVLRLAVELFFAVERLVVLFRAVVFLVVADERAAVVVFFLREDLPPLRDDDPPEREEREDDPEERDDDEDDDLDFVSPASDRCLLTVRAAISFARPVERPCFFSESLMCSY